jgi:Mlc titration factor MtfA (ptsG expression regulator)
LNPASNTNGLTDLKRPMEKALAILLFIFLPFGLLVLWAARSSGYLRKAPSLLPDQRRTIAKYVMAYQRLSSNDQQRFETIVSRFLHEKDWQGAGVEVKDEMKLMVSACAAQLLMGHPDLVLKHFERIIIYPDTYRSGRSGRMHQGEVRPTSGVIMISWRDFIHGYSHTRDAHNVGLHEMAHALWFEDRISNAEQGFLHPELLQDWIDHADGEIERIRSGGSRLFRSYAGTNQAEFFAVAVEYFFEKAHEFQKELPELYSVLSAMLKQDPARDQGAAVT